MHFPTHPAPRLSQVLPLISSVVIIRFYSSMAGLSPARSLAYTPVVRTQPDHASSCHCLHAPPPPHHTSAASHHSPPPPPPGTPPLDAPPADASSPDAQTPGMLPLVCCRSRAAARRVATRRPRCAKRRAPLTAATATPLTAMLSPPPPSLAAITADLTFSSASTTATSFAAVVVTAAC